MNIYIYILTMAATTYLIRAIPLIFIRKKIRNRFLNSVISYIPIACLSAMTFPAILYSTTSVLSGLIGFTVAVIVALKSDNLPLAAGLTCLAVYAAEKIIPYCS